MALSVKFLVVAIILAFASGMVGQYYLLFGLRYPFSVESYMLTQFVSGLVLLVLEIFVVFVVMYKLGQGISSHMITSGILSTFAGCWIGEVAAMILGQAIVFLNNAANYIFSYSDIPWVAWWLISFAFSRVFFVSMAAILWAQYRRGPSLQGSPPTPPRQMVSQT